MNENMNYSYLDESETSYLENDPYATSDVRQDQPGSAPKSTTSTSADRLTSSGRRLEPNSPAYNAIWKFARDKGSQVLNPTGYIRRQTLTEAGGWSYEIVRQSDGTIDIYLLSSPECKLYQGQTCAPGMSVVKPVREIPKNVQPVPFTPSHQPQKSQIQTAQAESFPWAWAMGGLMAVGLIGGGIWWAVHRNSTVK